MLIGFERTRLPKNAIRKVVYDLGFRLFRRPPISSGYSSEWLPPWRTGQTQPPLLDSVLQRNGDVLNCCTIPAKAGI